MTEQYGQRNINNPEGSRTEANTVADPDFTMTAADTGKMVIFTTTLVGVATLPNAAEAGAGAQVTIVAATGAAFSLEVIAAAGDTLVEPAGTPANPAITSNASFIARSDGDVSWYITAGLA